MINERIIYYLFSEDVAMETDVPTGSSTASQEMHSFSPPPYSLGML